MLFQILLNRVVGTSKTVPDPDLEMGGGGWGGGGGGVPPLDPPLENTTGSCQIRTTKGVITEG